MQFAGRLPCADGSSTRRRWAETNSFLSGNRGFNETVVGSWGQFGRKVDRHASFSWQLTVVSSLYLAPSFISRSNDPRRCCLAPRVPEGE